MSVGTWPTGGRRNLVVPKDLEPHSSEGNTEDRIRRSTSLQILPLARIHPSL
jgi:hypothetical protein